MSKVRHTWEWWLNLWYGAEKCPYGKRRGAHEWFYVNCKGCREDWIAQVERDATEHAQQRARREREERVSQMVEALRRFSASGQPVPVRLVDEGGRQL